MMERLWMIFSAALAAASLLTLCATGLHLLAAGCRSRREAAIGEQYLRILVATLMDEKAEPGEIRLPGIRRAGARRILAGVMTRLVASTYGLDPRPLRGVVEAVGLDRYVLRLARRSRGYSRAYRLMQLSRMPIGEPVAHRLRRFERSRYPCVRFYALMARLAHDPSSAFRLLGDMEHDLSVYEVSEVMALLRRGMLPVACAPLLDARQRNLRLLGIAIVRQYGIEEAARQLFRLATGDASDDVRREALLALGSMRRLPPYRELAGCVAALDAAERKALLRHMVREGYSAGALCKLAPEAERSYYLGLVESYKCRIACS